MLRSTRGYMGDIKGDVPLPWGKWGILTDPLRRKLWDGAQSQLCLLNTWAKLRISCSLKKAILVGIHPILGTKPTYDINLINCNSYVCIYICKYIYIRISIYMSYIGYIYIHIPLHPQFISPESSVNSQPLEGLEVPEGA